MNYKIISYKYSIKLFNNNLLYYNNNSYLIYIIILDNFDRYLGEYERKQKLNNYK